MISLALYSKDESGIPLAELQNALRASLGGDISSLRRALLLVPDYTRYYSNAGAVANFYYHELEPACDVNILPTLGTHAPMTRAECEDMYGDIPFEKFIVHNWRTDVVKLGEVPASFVREVSEGVMDRPISVEVNKRLFDGYDLILSIGQVVPHEVVGMANHSKNIFVGCGGSEMINSSHMLGAFYGLERMMGRDFSPVRRVFDFASERYLTELPLCYAFTVTTEKNGEIITHGLFVGPGRETFEQAVKLAQQKNIIYVNKPLKKVVVNLEAKEFKSTWLGNKAVYRTRMAIADGGELIILAPGVASFGEDGEIDSLIRKYGYCGREKVIELCRERDDLQNNLSAAAHLIHGSSDGRFSITYCTEKLSGDEVRGVCYNYLPHCEAVKRYDPSSLKDGLNALPCGEEIYYISNPALGLWSSSALD